MLRTRLGLNYEKETSITGFGVWSAQLLGGGLVKVFLKPLVLSAQLFDHVL